MKQYDYLIVGAGLFPPGIPLLTKFAAEPRTRPCGLAHSLR